MKNLILALIITSLILIAGCKEKALDKGETEGPAVKEETKEQQKEASTIKKVDIATQEEFVDEIDRLIEENLGEE